MLTRKIGPVISYEDMDGRAKGYSLPIGPIHLIFERKLINSQGAYVLIFQLEVFHG